MIVGTPVHIIYDAERLFGVGAARGFNLVPVVWPDGLPAFVDGLIEFLLRRRFLRTTYE